LPTWDIPRVFQDIGRKIRIGVDLGGVIFVHRANTWVRKALDGVRALISAFGAENVFIVSRVQLNGPLHRACSRALTKPRGFLEKTGMLLDNVVFVPTVDGPCGKGAIAAKLGLTHFVDDRSEVLKSVFADEAGNCGDLVRKFQGKLFHFEHGGKGERRPSEPAEMPDDFRKHYYPVSGWSEVMAFFSEDVHGVGQSRASKFTSSGVGVHRMQVSTEGTVGAHVVAQLLAGFAEIEDFTGVKILLRGKGSPHPQPKSEEQAPLSIVVRTKPGGGGLDIAVPLVEDLLGEALNLAA